MVPLGALTRVRFEISAGASALRIPLPACAWRRAEWAGARFHYPIRTGMRLRERTCGPGTGPCRSGCGAWLRARCGGLRARSSGRLRSGRRWFAHRGGCAVQRAARMRRLRLRANRRARLRMVARCACGAAGGGKARDFAFDQGFVEAADSGELAGAVHAVRWRIAARRRRARSHSWMAQPSSRGSSRLGTR